MSLEARMADAQFNMRTPLCNMCINKVSHKFDNKNPDKPTMTCAVIGIIPRALKLASTYDCEHCIISMERYDIYKDILPKSFNLDNYKKN